MGGFEEHPQKERAVEERGWLVAVGSRVVCWE
jgi:hypothetical protein